MKYIIIESKIKDDLIENIPIIFPKTLNHNDVSDCIIQLLKTKYNRDDNVVVSAGDYISNSIQVSGMSATLGVSSRKSLDNEIIKLIDYLPFKTI